MKPELLELLFMLGRNFPFKNLLLLAVTFSFSGCYEFFSIMERERALFQTNNPDASRFAPWKADSVHYVTAGNKNGIPLVFVHGSPGSWDANAHLLNDSLLLSQFFMISLDRPGFGKSLSGKPDGSLKSQAAALKAIFDAEQISRPAVLLGHSWGGPIIVQFADDFPELTLGLVNVAGSMDPDLEKLRWYNHAVRWRWVKRITAPEMTTSNEELWNAKSELTQLLPAWKKIAVPVVTVQGSKDSLVPKENADFVEKNTEKGIAFTYRIKDQGHFILWYRKDLIQQAILKAAQPIGENSK